MTARIDLTGQVFGDWTVIRPDAVHPGSAHARWVCRCVCGTQRSVRGDSLRSGRSNSCMLCANSRTDALDPKGHMPPVTSAATLGYSYEERLGGRYFAVLRHTLWRGRESTKFVVGYDNEDDADALVHALSIRKLKEGPRPE